MFETLFNHYIYHTFLRMYSILQKVMLDSCYGLFRMLLYSCHDEIFYMIFILKWNLPIYPMTNFEHFSFFRDSWLKIRRLTLLFSTDKKAQALAMINFDILFPMSSTNLWIDDKEEDIGSTTLTQKAEANSFVIRLFVCWQI